MCDGVLSLVSRWVVEAERQLRVDSVDANQDVARRDRIRDDIERRVRRACSHFTEEEFQQLVDEMTDRQIRGERRVARGFLLE